MFFVIILIPALAWSPVRAQSGGGVLAFAYALVTRPLGASFADYFSKPHSLMQAPTSGDATVAVITTLLVAAPWSAYLTVTRRDIQQPQPQEAGRRFARLGNDAAGR